MTPDDVRAIFQEMFDANYSNGAPKIPPHRHNGVDNLKINTSDLEGSVGSPAGTDKDVQFNDSGAFGGVADLTFDKSTDTLLVGSTADGHITSTKTLHISGNGDSGNDGVEIFANSNNNNRIDMYTQNTTASNSGEVDIFTGNTANASGQAGNINVFTGAGTAGANGGDMNIFSATITTGSGTSGNISISSGNNNSSGDVGSVNIFGGSANGGVPGEVDISAGSANAGNVNGGNVIISTGTKNGSGVDGNVGINGTRFGGGGGVIYIANATTVPSTNPTGGGILYTSAGALKYRGSAGTVTTIAVA